MIPVRTQCLEARNQSRKFMLAAQRCGEARPLPSGILQVLWVPSLVCYAFSVEVGLKALALHEHGRARRNSHDLKKLLRDLSPDLRAQIVRDTGDPDPKFFESNLDLVREVFDTWRYIYERGLTDTDLGFLQRFSGAVQKALNSLHYIGITAAAVSASASAPCTVKFVGSGTPQGGRLPACASTTSPRTL